MSLSGSCSCGAITYTCSNPPVMSGNCHCRECKKASGSGYAPTFFVPENTISIHGEVKWYERKGDSGQLVKRGFCPHCGSQLFGRPGLMPNLVAVRAGSLDDPAQYKPQVDIYTGDAPAWDCMDSALPKFPKAPPMEAAPKT